MTVRKAAVLGSPIEHSRSPLLHQAAYRQLGLDWKYDKVEVQTEELASFVAGLDDSWAGLSLTMPLKEEAVRLADEVSAVARLTGAANTLVLSTGVRAADNTDVAGLEYAINLGFAEETAPMSVTILGTGATARSTVAAVARKNPSAQVRIAGRTPENVDAIVAWASENFELAVTGHSLQSPEDDLLESDLVISTIPIDPMSLLISRVPDNPQVLVDVIYDPPTSPLSESWVAKGGVRVGGLMMLVGQATEQVRLMTGYDGPLGPVRRAMLEAVAASGEKL